MGVEAAADGYQRRQGSVRLTHLASCLLFAVGRADLGWVSVETAADGYQRRQRHMRLCA